MNNSVIPVNDFLSHPAHKGCGPSWGTVNSEHHHPTCFCPFLHIWRPQIYFLCCLLFSCCTNCTTCRSENCCGRSTDECAANHINLKCFSKYMCSFSLLLSTALLRLQDLLRTKSEHRLMLHALTEQPTARALP